MFFISTGCSYSQVPNADITWPVHVQDAFGLQDHEVNHTGVGAVGNLFISRKVIYHVTEALKTHKPEDLLVGIMWSGCDRHSFIMQENERTYSRATKLCMPDSYKQFLKEKKEISEHRLHFNNPIPIGITDEFNHHTLNCHWEDELTITYYNNFVDPLGSLVQTCENILKTEWFLKKHNIKYFMTAYDFDTFFFAGIPGGHLKLGYDKDCPALSINHQNYKCDVYHPDVKYLYDQIDMEYWLPVENMGQWAEKVSKFDRRDPTDPHPSTEQHMDFTKQIILPFLEKKYGISNPKLP